MKRVYVVAWASDSGQGFEWYYSPAIADEMYEAERVNCRQLKDEGWTAYRFDAVVTSYETASDEIQDHLDYYCGQADYWYKAAR